MVFRLQIKVFFIFLLLCPLPLTLLTPFHLHHYRSPSQSIYLTRLEFKRDKPQKPIFIDLLQFDPQWDKTSGKLFENNGPQHILSAFYI